MTEEYKDLNNALTAADLKCVRKIVVCVPVEIRASNEKAADEACEDAAKRVIIHRSVWFEHGVAHVKSFAGASWKPTQPPELPFYELNQINDPNNPNNKLMIGSTGGRL